MDSNILDIEEIVMGGGEAAAPAELPSEKTADNVTYTTSIQQHAPPPVIQSCEYH